MSTGTENKYFFYPVGSLELHYYDEDHRVYTEAGALVRDCSWDFKRPSSTPSVFTIDGLLYWFDRKDGLMYQDAHDKAHRVQVDSWSSDSGPRIRGDLSEHIRELKLACRMGVPDPDSESESDSEVVHHTGSASFTMPTFYPSTTPDIELGTHSPNFSSELEPRGESTSSRGPSPIESRAPSEEPPSRPELQRDVSSPSSIIRRWKEDTECIKQAKEREQPAPTSDKIDRRRCPICNQVFRRPIGLQEHLNTHSGEKPHACPFERCNTRFATKSNMKRHFLIHRVGPLDNYKPTVTAQPSMSATRFPPLFHLLRPRVEGTTVERGGIVEEISAEPRPPQRPRRPTLEEPQSMLDRVDRYLSGASSGPGMNHTKDTPAVPAPPTVPTSQPSSTAQEAPGSKLEPPKSEKCMLRELLEKVVKELDHDGATPRCCSDPACQDLLHKIRELCGGGTPSEGASARPSTDTKRLDSESPTLEPPSRYRYPIRIENEEYADFPDPYQLMNEHRPSSYFIPEPGMRPPRSRPTHQVTGSAEAKPTESRKTRHVPYGAYRGKAWF